MNKEYFPITDKKMTRFNITLDEATTMVLKVLKTSVGGEIFVPKLKSYKVIDLARAMNQKNKLKIIGVRPGEKIHEQMISSSDSYNTVEFGKFYVILPQGNEKLVKKFLSKNKGEKVKENFEYTSGKNGKFLNLNELKKLIKNHEKKKL